MKQVVDQETAEAEIAEIEEEFGIVLDPGYRRIVLRRIMSGDLSRDGDVFVLRLVAPIEQENGKRIEELRIEEPTAEIIRRATGDEMTMTLKMLSSVTHLSLGVIDRLKMRDITAAGAVLGFFA